MGAMGSEGSSGSQNAAATVHLRPCTLFLHTDAGNLKFPTNGDAFLQQRYTELLEKRIAQLEALTEASSKHSNPSTLTGGKVLELKNGGTSQDNSSKENGEQSSKANEEESPKSNGEVLSDSTLRFGFVQQANLIR